jgi:CBS domain-containing protein
MKVQDIMTPHPRTASPRTTLAEASQQLWNGDCGILPVIDEGALVGVVTDRDMYVALGTRDARASQITVGDVATRTVWTCAPTDDVHVALGTMKERRVRRLPVVADGSLVGIISLNDVALVAGAGKPVQDEEIVDTFKAICAHRSVPATVAA